jgi:hypothetical protein
MELDNQSNRRKEKMLRRQDGEDKFVGRENTSRREEKRRDQETIKTMNLNIGQ